MAGGIQLATAYVAMSLRRGRVVSDARRELAQVERATASSGTRAGSSFASRFTGHVRSMGARVGSIVAGIGRRIGSVLSTAFKVGAAGLAALLGYSLKKGFERLSSIDQATHKLAGLGHSGKQVSAIMDNALKSVKGTAFGLDEAATTAAGAVAAGVTPGKNLTRTLSLTADAATIAGTSMGDMGAIFNKVATSNKIQGDVIAQLSDKGIPIVQLLAKTLHKSAGEVVDLASAGKINFAQFQDAMQKGLGGAAKKSGDTFTGAFANLKASLGRIGANLLSGIFPQLAPNVQKLTTALGPLEDKAKVVGAAIGRFLNKALVKLPPLLANLRRDWDELKMGFTAGDLGPAETRWQRIGAIFKTLRDTFKGKNISGALDRVKQAFTGFTSGVDAGAVQQLFEGVGKSAPLFNASLRIAGKALGFLTSHMKLVGALLPVFLSFVLAGKAANSVFGKNSLVGYNLRTAATIAQAVATTANTRAIRANRTASRQLTVQQNAGLLARVRGTAATVASTIAEKAATVARKAGVVAQRLLNAAMRANLIGIVITGLLLLGAAFVALWTKSATFRRIVTGAWNGIRAAALAVVSWFKNTAWPWMNTTMRKIGSVVAWLWNHSYGVYFRLIWNLAKAVFGWIKNTGLPWVRSALQAIGNKATWLWRNAIRPAFDFIKAGARAVTTGFTNAKRGIGVALSGIGSAASTVWHRTISPVFDAIKRGVGLVKTGFVRAKDGITTAWAKIRDAARKPVAFVINRVVRPFIGGINKVLGFVHLGQIPKPAAMRTGGVLSGYTPGRDVHRFYSPTGGELDLSGGEAILRPEATRALGPGWVNQVNRAARTGGVGGVRGALGFAGGGILGKIKNGLSSMKDFASGLIPGWVRKVLTFLKSPTKAFTGWMAKGGDWAGQVARGAIGKTAGAFKDRVFGGLRSVLGKLHLGWVLNGGGGPGFGGPIGGSGSGAPGSGWQWQWNLIHRMFPGAVLTSAFRPGARTAGYGNVSYHALGRAIDVGGPASLLLRIANWIKATYGAKSHDLIYAGGWGHNSIYEGHPFRINDATYRNHLTHVHWGYDRGGILPGAFPARRQVTPPVFDRGGTLAPGLNVVDNRLGRPERLVRADDHAAGMVNNIYAQSDKARDIVHELSWAVRTSALPSVYGRPT